MKQFDTIKNIYKFPNDVKRNSNYDLIRVYAMFMVILNHIADYYLLKTSYTNVIIFGLEGLSHCAIPLFLMLTGAVVIDKAKDVQVKKFYFNSFKKLMIPTLFFCVIYWIHDYRMNNITDITKILHGLETGFLGLYAHWYMFMLIGIYAMIPIIAFVKPQVTQKSYEIFAVLYFIWAMCSRHFDTTMASWTIGSSLTFLGYVFIGDVIKQRFKKKSTPTGIYLILLGIILLLLDYYIVFLKVQAGDSYYNRWFSLYSAPLVSLASILLFTGFIKLEIKYSNSFLAKQSFIVYLCHKLVIDWLDSFFKKLESVFQNDLKVIIPIEFVVVFAISLLIAVAINTLIMIIKKLLIKRSNVLTMNGAI